MKKVVLLADANSSHSRKWIAMLLELGIHVRIFSFYPAEDHWLKENNIEHEAFFSQSGVSLLKKLRYPLAYFKAKAFLGKTDFDFVNAHYASSYGLLAVLLKPKRLILNFWGTDVFVFPKKSWLHKNLIRWITSKANTLCASSVIMKEEIGQYTNQSVELVPFGIDLDEYPLKPELSIPKNNGVIFLGMVKSLEPVYRIDVAIDALKLLNEKSPIRFELHIAGAGSLEQEMKTKSTNSVFFYGKIKQNDVPVFLHRLDIFLNTTDFESFGVSTIEAMACGVPVVAHNSGGSAEIIEHNNNGLLYTPNKPDALAEKILQLVEDPKQYETLAKQARNHIEMFYSLKITKSKIAAIFGD